MNKIEIKKGKRIYDGRSIAQPIERETEIITVDDYKQLLNFKKTIKSSEINTNGNIFFQKGSNFPRRRLNQILPNKKVSNINNAEYVIIGEKTIPNYIYLSGIPYDLINGELVFDHTKSLQQTSPSSVQIYHEITSSWQKDLVDLYNLLITKKVVWDHNLAKMLPKEVKVQGDFYRNLSKMLGSSDKNTVKLAAEMLCNVNYTDYKTEIVLLLNQYFQNIRSYGGNTTIMFKSLLTTVNTDFPSWHTGNKLKFILEIADTKNFSKEYIDYIDTYFNSVHKLSNGKRYKLIIE